jgi:hypothetical protein
MNAQYIVTRDGREFEPDRRNVRKAGRPMSLLEKAKAVETQKRGRRIRGDANEEYTLVMAFCRNEVTSRQARTALGMAQDSNFLSMAGGSIERSHREWKIGRAKRR